MQALLTVGEKFNLKLPMYYSCTDKKRKAILKKIHSIFIICKEYHLEEREAETVMKFISVIHRKIACLLLFTILFLSLLDESHTFSTLPVFGRACTSSLPILAEADTGIIPDYLTAKENVYSGYTAIINRTPIRRQTNACKVLSFPEDANISISYSPTAFFLYITVVFHQSRQLIIRYIHDKDGEKTRLLYLFS